MRKWVVDIAMLLPLPFLLVTTIKGEKIKMNWARIIEAVIMATIVGLLTSYITVRELTVKVDALNYRLNRIENYIMYREVPTLPPKIKNEK